MSNTNSDNNSNNYTYKMKFNKKLLVAREVICVYQRPNIYNSFYVSLREYPSPIPNSPTFIDNLITSPSKYFSYPAHPVNLPLIGISILIISANFAFISPFRTNTEYTKNVIIDIIRKWLSEEPYICVAIFNHSSIPTLYHNFYPLYNYINSIFQHQASSKTNYTYDYQGILSNYIPCEFPN
jgi:hypothetical protein